MAPDPLDALLAEQEARSLFTPIRTVPATTAAELANTTEVRLQERWPKLADTLPEQVGKLWRLQEPYTWRQIWALDWGNKILVVLNGISCLYVGGLFRKAVKLTGGGAGAVNVLMPGIVGSTIFGVVIHARVATIPMALRPTRDHYLEVFKSTFGHVATSCIYPTLFTMASSIYFALRYNSFPVPEDFVRSPESRRYLLQKIIQPTLRKHRTGLMAMVVLNGLAAAGLTAAESNQLSMMYYNLATDVREELEAEKKLEASGGGGRRRQVVIGNQELPEGVSVV